MSICPTCGSQRIATDEYVLDTLIADIEAQKARIRIDYDDLKKDYHRSDWRKHGLTKRECELRLSKRSGEVLGMEYALSVLYKERSKGEE